MSTILVCLVEHRDSSCTSVKFPGFEEHLKATRNWDRVQKSLSASDTVFCTGTRAFCSCAWMCVVTLITLYTAELKYPTMRREK